MFYFIFGCVGLICSVMFNIYIRQMYYSLFCDGMNYDRNDIILHIICIAYMLFAYFYLFFYIISGIRIMFI